MKKVYLFFISILLSCNLFSQAFMNGSFENNTAGTDQINMSNAAYNAMMANTVAFGTFGDMDIISSATYCGLAQNGNWYTALTGSNTDMITMQLTAPLVAGNTYTISWYDKGCWPMYSGFSPPVQIGVSTVAGALGTAVITGPTPANGTWTPESGTFVAPNNGQYISVTLTSGGLGDWTQIDNFQFVVSSAPVANFTASQTNICPNTCINFTDMSTGAPTSWSWTFAGATPASSTAQNPTNICYATAGTYAVTLTATNANGSNTMNQTTYITVNPTPSVTAVTSGTLTCTNTSVTLTGTSAGNTMVWNGGSLSNAANPATVTSPGTYTCTATSPAGCTNTTSVIVMLNTTPPTVSGTASGSLSCSVTSVTLTGNSPGNTMVWNGPSLTNAPDPATATTAGTYTVTATNPANGCTNTATVAVTFSGTLPTVTATASGTITCTNTSVTLTGTSPGNTMVWNGGSLTNAPDPATVTAAGTYTVTATDPSTGCQNTTTVTVTSNTTPPTVTASNTNINCINSTATLTGTSAGNTMVWNGGSLSNAADPASVTAAGTYTVTATDPANGCTSTATVTVTSNTTPPTVTATGNNITCSSPNSTLTGTSANSTMVWNGGSLTNAPNPATVTTAGTYTVTAVDNTNGCQSTATVTITTNTTPPSVTSATPDTLTCIAPTEQLSVTCTTAGVTYSWTGPGIVSGGSSPGPVVNAGGNYICTVTNPANGCTTTVTVTVAANINPPSATVSGGATINLGSSVVLTATGGGNYTWSPTTGLSCTTCASPTATPQQTTNYCVTVTDASGCTDSACTTIVVDIICGEFGFPNAFSPNDDGLNEIFRCRINPGCIRDYHLVVYDRWGEMVFETTDYTQGWDGTFKGQPLDNAVFVYYATATLASTGEKLVRKGNVSLIR